MRSPENPGFPLPASRLRGDRLRRDTLRGKGRTCACPSFPRRRESTSRFPDASSPRVRIEPECEMALRSGGSAHPPLFHSRQRRVARSSCTLHGASDSPMMVPSGAGCRPETGVWNGTGRDGLVGGSAPVRNFRSMETKIHRSNGALFAGLRLAPISGILAGILGGYAAGNFLDGAFLEIRLERVAPPLANTAGLDPGADSAARASRARLRVIPSLVEASAARRHCAIDREGVLPATPPHAEASRRRP